MQRYFSQEVCAVCDADIDTRCDHRNIQKFTKEWHNIISDHFELFCPSDFPTTSGDIQTQWIFGLYNCDFGCKKECHYHGYSHGYMKKEQYKLLQEMTLEERDKVTVYLNVNCNLQTHNSWVKI